MHKLVQACELSLNDWSATFSETIPEPVYSKKYNRWKKNLFDKMRDDHYHIFTTKTIKVMWVAAIISVMLLAAFVIPSSREYFIDSFDGFSMYKLTENNKNSISGEITVGYIPDGFKLTEKDYSNKLSAHQYESSSNQHFIVLKYSSSMEVYFDTENYMSEEIVIDGVKYIYCQDNDGVDNLIWTKNDYIYKLDAPFEKEELLKIAKNVN